MLKANNEILTGQYFGTTKKIFGLAMVTSFLTLITLGVYRFWAKTRIRRYIWSSVRIGGDALEYTGTGLEKFLGFLVAVVVLAVYLGLVQLLLFYFGLNMFIQPTTEAEILPFLGAVYGTMLSVVPLMFYAEYRATRYKLSRTRWRGIRFGMDKAPWGYTWRAILYWILAMISFGLAAPLMTFRLAKYKGDRTWFGDAKFLQDGKWYHLYRGMKHVGIGLVILVGGITLGVWAQSVVTGIIFAIIGYVWVFIGMVAYQVYALSYLTERKLLAGNLKIYVAPRTSEIAGRILLVGLGIGVIVAVFFGVAGYYFNEVVLQNALSGEASMMAFVIPSLLYIVAMLLADALMLAWIIQPILSHVASSLRIENSVELLDIQQRAAASGVDAEGFADALDIGAAI